MSILNNNTSIGNYFFCVKLITIIYADKTPIIYSLHSLGQKNSNLYDLIEILIILPFCYYFILIKLWRLYNTISLTSSNIPFIFLLLTKKHIDKE
jgi:hypothetical protein